MSEAQQKITMSPREREEFELKQMLAEIQNIKLRTFSYLAVMSRYSERDLVTSGYSGKTVAEAMKMAFEQSLKEIDKVQAAYIKKYPDD